jgi:hypothetical protein
LEDFFADLLAMPKTFLSLFDFLDFDFDARSECFLFSVWPCIGSEGWEVLDFLELFTPLLFSPLCLRTCGVVFSEVSSMDDTTVGATVEVDLRFELGSRVSTFPRGARALCFFDPFLLLWLLMLLGFKWSLCNVW